MKKTLYIILPFLCLGFMLARPAGAQINEDYFIANRLFQERKYEQALQRFKRLYENNPGTYLFLERTTECLVNLKRYDEAITLTQEAVRQGRFTAQGGIRLGEIHHIQGDTSRAYSLWDQVIRQNEDNLQVYLILARTMRDRRAFDHSIATYRKADSLFPNTLILASEMAQTYMMAGRYEKAVRNYLELVEENPDRISFVQDNLLRYDDEHLFDVAILEIEEYLESLSTDHPAHRNIHNLLVWLLMERNLFERALVTAKNYEQQSSRVSYTLYSLGEKLLAEQKFELAEEAYRFYIDRNIYPVVYQSMEKLAGVYIEWGTYLSRHNLAFSTKRDSLFRRAFSTLEQLKSSAGNYRAMNRVLVTQAELALDHLYNPGNAQTYLDQMNPGSDTTALAHRNYIHGRIQLYNKEYTRARISFTQSNRMANIGELAEKTRYYLALTDFFAGDYDFAKVQLNALERKNTSYYANDALKLRGWIQEGLNADSSGASIDPFARAIEMFAQGRREQAMQQLDPVINGNAPHPLQDDALLEISAHLTEETLVPTYALLQQYLNFWGRSSPLRERLMWERARIADQLVTQPGLSAGTSADTAGAAGPNVEIPSTVEEVTSLYEEILLNYPRGFYATYARNRIQELQNIQT